MSLPSFDNFKNVPSTEEALAAIVGSIAVEEIALASILESESKKLCHVIKNTRPDCAEDMHTLLQINKSVENVLADAVDMQMLLKNKLRLVLEYLPKPPAPPCPHPKPPTPPCNKCMAIFHACNKYQWSAGKTLFLQEDPFYQHLNTCGLTTVLKHRDSFISMPAKGDFRVDIDFVLLNPCNASGYVELKHEVNGITCLTKEYDFNCNEIKICDVLDIKNNCKQNSLLSFRLLSDTPLKFQQAVVKVTWLASGTYTTVDTIKLF